MRFVPARAALAALVLTVGCRSDFVSHSVQVVIPPDVPIVTSGLLHAELWAHDPVLADGPATLVDATQVTFSHRAGAIDRVRMRLEGEVAAGMRTYVTVRGYQPSPAGERYILWDGQQQTGMPRMVTMRPVPEA